MLKDSPNKKGFRVKRPSKDLMVLFEAIQTTTESAGWNVTKLACEAGVYEDTARMWLRGKSEPRGASIVRLLSSLPGLHDALKINAVPALPREEKKSGRVRQAKTQAPG